MWKKFARVWETAFVIGFIVSLYADGILLKDAARRRRQRKATTMKTSNCTSLIGKRRLQTFYSNMSDVFYPRIHVLWPFGFIITLKEYLDWQEIEFHANINEPYDPLNYSDVSCNLRPVKYNGEWFWMYGTHDVHKKVRCLDKVDYCMYVAPPERDEKIPFRLRRETVVQCYDDIFIQT